MGQAQGNAMQPDRNERHRNRTFHGNSGIYFGENFTFAGHEFQTITPESFLFGDMADLNLLSQIAGSMPHVPPQVKHTNTLRALVNLRKNSLRLVQSEDTTGAQNAYHLKFRFDADCSCEVAIHLFVEEVVEAGSLQFRQYRTDHTLPCESFSFPAGFGQEFDFAEYALEFLNRLSQEDLDYFIRDNRLFFPLAAEGTISLRVIAQKVHVDGVTYLLREIYGLEQKADHDEMTNSDANASDEEDEDASECVVCMSAATDTMVLPCRHLCLCNDCAEVLRHQSSKCPICRAPFHSVLRLRVAKRAEDLTNEELEQDANDQDNTPTGYHALPIVEALQRTSQNPHGYLQVGSLNSSSSTQIEILQVSQEDGSYSTNVSDDMPKDSSFPIPTGGSLMESESKTNPQNVTKEKSCPSESIANDTGVNHPCSIISENTRMSNNTSPTTVTIPMQPIPQNLASSPSRDADVFAAIHGEAISQTLSQELYNGSKKFQGIPLNYTQDDKTLVEPNLNENLSSDDDIDE